MKNKKTIILVGLILLLVLSVGVTFAYFVTGVKKEGTGSSTNINTATVEDTVLKVEGSINPDTNSDVYPGHKSISELKVTATGELNTLYNLVWTGTNTLKTTFKYYVYKTSTKQTPTITCTKQEDIVDGEYHYYEECTNNNFNNLGEIISSGEIASTSTESTVKLIKNERLQATKSGATLYYYIVIEYPNEEGSQNLDKTGAFNGETTVNILKEEEPTLKSMILADNGGEDAIRAKGNPNFSKTACTPGTYNGTARTCGEDTTGMWAMEDDYGTSYYFRGSPTNNYVKFGKYLENYPDFYIGYYDSMSGNSREYNTLNECQNASSYNVNCTLVSKAGKDMYWRVIRINGDGTIRMIYDGTEYHANGSRSYKDVEMKRQTFSGSINFYSNERSGYTYATGLKRGGGSSSNAKLQLDSWYTSSGLSSYASYLADTGFCGDRSTYNYDSPYAANESLGTGTSKTTYGAQIRLVANKTPNLKCEKLDYGSKNDVYTVSTTKGNGELQYPIGLITADEVSVAGGKYSVSSDYNYGYYLNNGVTYWTMSPSSFNGSSGDMIIVKSSGDIYNINPANYTYYLYPVINLDSTKINNITIDDNGVYVVS